MSQNATAAAVGFGDTSRDWTKNTKQEINQATGITATTAITFEPMAEYVRGPGGFYIWEKNIRTKLESAGIYHLLDMAYLRPRKTDPNAEKWKEISMATAGWMMAHMSKPICNEIKGKNKSLVFADETFEAVRAYLVSGFCHADLKLWTSFANIRRADYRTTADFVNAALDFQNKLRDAKMAVRPYSVMMAILSELRDTSPGIMDRAWDWLGAQDEGYARSEKFLASMATWLIEEFTKEEKKTAEANRATEAKRVADAKKADEPKKAEGGKKAERAAAAAKKAEEARKAAEAAKRAEEAKRAEAEEMAAEALKTEEAKKAWQAQRAELVRQAGLARQAAEARRAEEAKRVEEARKAEEEKKAAETQRAAAAKKAEQARKAAEAQKAELAKKAEEAKRAEEARKADEKKKAADAKRAEEAKKAELAKLIAERLQEAREREEAVHAAAFKRVQEARQAEVAKKLQHEAIKLEDAQKLEAAKKLEESKKLEEARKRDEALRATEIERIAEARKAEEAKKQEEAKRVSEAKKVADAKRVADPKKAVQSRQASETLIIRAKAVVAGVKQQIAARRADEIGESEGVKHLQKVVTDMEAKIALEEANLADGLAKGTIA